MGIFDMLGFPTDRNVEKQKKKERDDERKFNQRLKDIDPAVRQIKGSTGGNSGYGSTKGMNSMDWVLRKRRMDAVGRTMDYDENGNATVNKERAKELEDYERRRDTPAKTKFSITRNGVTYSGTDVDKFSQDLKNRRGTKAAREFLASRGNKSMQELLNSRDELLKEFDKARKDPNSLIGLSRDQVRDRGFEAYIHNIKNQDAKNQKELATSMGKTGKATVGQRVGGASYDRFGMPVDPGPLAAIDMNGLTSRERAQIKMEHGRQQQAYRMAMKIWRQENPEAAQRGMTAKQFYKERYIMSDQYRTDQARARLENAVEASRRRQLNDLASQIEAHNFLNGRSPVQGTLSQQKAAPGQVKKPSGQPERKVTVTSGGQVVATGVPSEHVPDVVNEYNRSTGFIDYSSDEGNYDKPAPMTMNEFNRTMNETYPDSAFYRPTDNTDETDKRVGPRI